MKKKNDMVKKKTTRRDSQDNRSNKGRPGAGRNEKSFRKDSAKKTSRPPENRPYGSGSRTNKYEEDFIPDRNFNDSAEREDRVEGKNPVFEAIRSGQSINKLYVEKDGEDAFTLRIVAMAREKGIPVQYLERKKLDLLSKTRAHQGVILELAAREYSDIDDLLKIAEDKGEQPFLIVLDGITDPNNLGSIIRSAECSGVHGIVLPKRRSAPLNATVAKVAAGALEYVPVARVANLVQTLRSLKNAGLWIIGADMEGAEAYYDSNLTGPCTLVIGSEGEGLSRLVKDECDLLVRIPMKGNISSLNAGVAAALIMFEISRQRDRKSGITK